jgi:hypothetical protein
MIYLCEILQIDIYLDCAIQITWHHSMAIPKIEIAANREGSIRSRYRVYAGLYYHTDSLSINPKSQRCPTTHHPLHSI